MRSRSAWWRAHALSKHDNVGDVSVPTRSVGASLLAKRLVNPLNFQGSHKVFVSKLTPTGIVFEARKRGAWTKRNLLENHSVAGCQLPTICTIPSAPSSLNCPCDPAALADNVTPLGSRTGL
jgi:hypothetical protein